MFITDSRAYWNGFILLVAFCGVTWRFKQEVQGPRHFPKHQFQVIYGTSLFHHFGSDFKRVTHYSIIASVLEENDTHHLKPLSAKVCVSLKLWLMCCHFANFSPCKMACSFTSIIVFHCLLLFIFTKLNSIYPRFVPIIPGDAVVWEKRDFKTELICLVLLPLEKGVVLHI